MYLYGDEKVILQMRPSSAVACFTLFKNMPLSQASLHVVSTCVRFVLETVRNVNCGERLETLTVGNKGKHAPAYVCYDCCRRASRATKRERTLLQNIRTSNLTVKNRPQNRHLQHLLRNRHLQHLPPSRHLRRLLRKKHLQHLPRSRHPQRMATRTKTLKRRLLKKPPRRRNPQSRRQKPKPRRRQRRARRRHQQRSRYKRPMNKLLTTRSRNSSGRSIKLMWC